MALHFSAGDASNPVKLPLLQVALYTENEVGCIHVMVSQNLARRGLFGVGSRQSEIKAGEVGHSKGVGDGILA